MQSNLFKKAADAGMGPEMAGHEPPPEMDAAEDAADPNEAMEPEDEASEAGESGEAGGSDDLNNPAFKQAVEMVQTKLYKEGAGKQLGEALAMAENPVDGLVEQTRMLLTVVDDVTNGSVPDELYMVLGITLLGEVAEIGEAFGIDTSGKTLAEATRKFMAAVIEDIGGDASQVRQAMEALDSGQIGSALDKARAAEEA